MILAIVSIAAVALFVAALLLVFSSQESSESEYRRDYAKDMAYLLWGDGADDELEWRIAAAQADSRAYGSVSLREEGEAWRSTLCHGPDDCHN